jgi:flagellar hook-length control protein FliK
MSDMLAMLLGAGSDKASQVLAGLGGKAGHKIEVAGLAADGAGGLAGKAVEVEPFVALLSDRIEALQGQGAEGAVADPVQPGSESKDAQSQSAMLDPSVLQVNGLPVLPGAGLLAAGAQGAISRLGITGMGEAAGSADSRSGGKLAQGRAAVLAALRQSLPQATGSGAGSGPVDAGRGTPGEGVEFSLRTLVVTPQGDGKGLGLNGASPSGPGMPASAGSLVQALAAPMGGAGGVAGSDTPILASGGSSSALTPVAAGVSPLDATPRASAPLQLSVDAPLRSPQFPQELGDRVVWLATRQGQVAEVALNPPHLGPLEVRLSLNGSEAGAQFYSPHAAVRDALEAALPRLKEMLAEAGVTLGQAQVRDEALPRQSDLAQSGHGRKEEAEGAEGDSLSLEAGGLAGQVPGSRVAGLGLVDLYI